MTWLSFLLIQSCRENMRWHALQSRTIINWQAHEKQGTDFLQHIMLLKRCTVIFSHTMTAPCLQYISCKIHIPCPILMGKIMWFIIVYLIFILEAAVLMCCRVLCYCLFICVVSYRIRARNSFNFRNAKIDYFKWIWGFSTFLCSGLWHL